MIWPNQDIAFGKMVRQSCEHHKQNSVDLCCLAVVAEV